MISKVFAALLKVFELLAMAYAVFMAFVTFTYLPQISGMISATLVFLILAEIAFSVRGQRLAHVDIPEWFLVRIGGLVLVLLLVASVIFVLSLMAGSFVLVFFSTLFFAAMMILATSAAIASRQHRETIEED